MATKFNMPKEIVVPPMVETPVIETPVVVEAVVAPEAITIVETVTVAAPAIESTLVLADADPRSRSRPRQFYVASQWHIMPIEDHAGLIEAVNNTTGDRYRGSIKDFNDMLRGE